MKNDFTDLVLIIGTSPLPNYVVANYFCQNNNYLEKIWFIYADKNENQNSTRKFAENIQSLLLKKCKRLNSSMFKYVPIKNIENIQQISNTLIRTLNFRPESKVHLNFTGGTKVMVVQTYNFINDHHDISEKSFSYLSSRTYKLTDSDNNIICSDLRPNIILSIADLLSLHNYERNNQPESYDFSKTIEQFKKLTEERNANDFFNEFDHSNAAREWEREIFLNEQNNLVNKINQLNEEEIKKKRPTSKKFLDIIQSMPEELIIYDRNGNFIKPKNNRYLRHALGFLDGKWLEEYVYQISKNELNDFTNITIDKNWEIKHPDWQNNKFEIDLIIIKGYQLFGISCTTISKNKAAIKNKGFEIILRSKQIGGEEAKAMLITLADDNLTKKIENELQIETGAKRNIIVLGKKVLQPDALIRKIKDFIK